MLGLLLIYYFPAAIALVVAAPAPLVKMPSFPLIYNGNASDHSIVSSLAPSSLSNSTPNSFNPPPDPWMRQTSAGSTIIISDYGTARRLESHRADVRNVLAEAEAEAVRRAPRSPVPRLLGYSEEHAFLGVSWSLPEVTWSVWSAALEEILYFNRNWPDITWNFWITQPSGPRPGTVTRMVASGQLRVR